MSEKPIDAAIVVVVGPCIDAATFLPRTDIAYDALGLVLDWFQEMAGGTVEVTGLTPTVDNWIHRGAGYYGVALTALQNDARGVVWVAGSCTGVMAFESPHYDVVSAAAYDNPIGLGAGAIAWSHYLSEADTTPIADAAVWVTTDIAGNNIIASGRTNDAGVVTFFLDAGPVYVWAAKAGWNFTNPDLEVVS